MMTLRNDPKATLALTALAFLAACGGSSTGSSGAGTTVDEVDGVAGYTALADTAAMGSTTISLMVRIGTDLTSAPENVQLQYSTGAFTGGLLDGTNLSDPSYPNPTDNEFSRVINLSASSVFGTGGLETDTNDMPGSGTVNYNLGWVAMTVTDESDGSVYVLEGEATLQAFFDAADVVGGTFDNLDGTVSNSGGGDQPVNNVGTITLENASISGNTFAGGDVSGSGLFAPLDGDSNTGGIWGRFYGPAADEIGGVLLIEDTGAQLDIMGAFIAD